MKIVIDINEFKSLIEKEFKWDRAHKEECGWTDRDTVMIAEGMKEATDKLTEMVYVTKSAKEIICCRDCKHNKSGFCDHYELGEDDFCSRGEK